MALKSILGWESTTGKAAFQSNFKFSVEDTLNVFHLHATNIYVTRLQDRIHFFLLKELTEDVSESRFSIEYERWESSNENTEHFANIWMAALAPFAPS